MSYDVVSDRIESASLILTVESVSMSLKAEQPPVEKLEYRVNRQEFTNVKGMYSGASVVLRVENTDQYDEARDYLNGDYMFDIHDCYRRVHVHVNLSTPWERYNSLQKVRKFAELAMQYRDAIEAEIASIEAKETKKGYEELEASQLVPRDVTDITGQKPRVVPGEVTVMPDGESLARQLPVSNVPEPTPENCNLWC